MFEHLGSSFGGVVWRGQGTVQTCWWGAITGGGVDFEGL